MAAVVDVPHMFPRPDPFRVDALADRIRASSNFRFSWQFYECDGLDPDSMSSVRAALSRVIASPELHTFMRDTFVPEYDSAFAIEPLHEHCPIVHSPVAFADILARAAGDHLGAYSKELRDASESERREVEDLFRTIGRYRAYELLPGNVPGCPVCQSYSSHIFSTWFYGVAWDWCLMAVWPERKVFWIGCLTDTD